MTMNHINTQSSNLTYSQLAQMLYLYLQTLISSKCMCLFSSLSLHACVTNSINYSVKMELLLWHKVCLHCWHKLTLSYQPRRILSNSQTTVVC